MGSVNPMTNEPNEPNEPNEEEKNEKFCCPEFAGCREAVFEFKAQAEMLATMARILRSDFTRFDAEAAQENPAVCHVVSQYRYTVDAMKYIDLQIKQLAELAEQINAELQKAEGEIFADE